VGKACRKDERNLFNKNDMLSKKAAKYLEDNQPTKELTATHLGRL